MLPNLKKISPEKSPETSSGFFKWIGRKLWQYACRQKKCLIMAAVILLVFFVLNRYNFSSKSDGQFGQAQILNALIEETAELSQPPLAGSFNLTAAAIPTAQASVDFSADDELENKDFSILEGSGLVAPGLTGNAFSGMQKEVITYLVVQGDSPFSIAVKFNINTDTILWANNLREGDLIRPGDKLLVLPINGVRVKVGSQDTIASLAKKYQGKTEEIMAFNDIIDESKLVAGSFIIIPDGEMPAPAKPKIVAPKYAKETTPVSNWLIAPTAGKVWGRLHGYNGIDISNACGTPIYAAAAGQVILSDGIGWNFGYGKYIMIKHSNGVITVYGHASQLLVNTGDSVGQGQTIALMGTTGRSTGCHVHFEVRGAKNPMAKK